MDIDMIDAGEAAKLLGVSESQFRVYARADKFKTAKKSRGTRWFISRDEVDGIVDGSIDVNFSGAWGEVYGKED